MKKILITLLLSTITITAFAQRNYACEMECKSNGYDYSYCVRMCEV